MPFFFLLLGARGGRKMKTLLADGDDVEGRGVGMAVAFDG